MTVTAAQAAEHLLRLRDANSSFPGFCHALFPNMRFVKFQVELMELLDAIEKNTIPQRRVLINMPPRHGKSFIANEVWPVYYMARNPTRFILTVSYSQELAAGFGRRTRDIAREQIVTQSFPGFAMSPESRAVDDWRTTSGGAYYATGIGGVTTGKPATCLIVDDPVKAREEAESATIRNKIWAYYVSALTTRKQPELDGTPPIEIVIMTRWHPDDLAGRIMHTEDWKEGAWLHVNLPARTVRRSDVGIPVTSLPPDDPRYVAPEDVSKLLSTQRVVYEETREALWPERFPLEELDKRERLDPREFASLYQQSPFIQGGNLIKANQFKLAKTPPTDLVAIIISCDTAFKKAETSDYTVMLAMGITSKGDIHVLDMQRGRYTFPELRRAATIYTARWRGEALRGLYIEDRASGQSLIQEMRLEGGIAVIGYRAITDKVARVNLVTPLIEGGRVFVPEDAPWLDVFMDEMQQFPSGKHDDIVDALSMGLDTLSRMGVASVDLQKPLIESLDNYANKFQPLKAPKPTSNGKLPEWAKGEFVRWGEL